MDLNDLDTSVSLLSKSFTTWQQYQKNGVVRVNELKKYKKQSDELPTLIHNGSKCQLSKHICDGKFASIYFHPIKNKIYKIVKFPESEERLSLLKCSIKEMCLLRLMTDLHLENEYFVKCHQVQLILKQGKFRKFIYELETAKYDMYQYFIDNQEKLEYKQYLLIFKQILESLLKLHQFDIYHGDIKPENILIFEKEDQSISAKLCDFSLSNVEGKGTEITYGSFFWRPPECLDKRQDMITYSKQSDIWSIGFVMLDVLYSCVFTRDILRLNENHSFDKTFEILQNFLKYSENEFIDMFSNLKIKHKHITKNQVNKILSLVYELLRINKEERPDIVSILRYISFLLKEKQEEGKYKMKEDKKTKKEEKDFILKCQKICEYCSIFFDMEKNNWFFNDCYILWNMIKTRLDENDITFDEDALLKYVIQFFAFLWFHYYPKETEEMESIIFHIMTLSEFHIFF